MHIYSCTAKRFVPTILIIIIAISCCGCAPNVKRNTANDVTVITLWHPWGGTQKERLTGIIDEFNKTHPHIYVEPLFTPTDLGSNQKFFTAVVANKAPDVVFVDGTQTAAWAEQGAIMPLDKLVKRDCIKPCDYFTPCWKQNCYKGHVWALTYCADPNFAFAWNKSIFRKVGLDPEKPPRTIEELDRYNNIITKVQNGKIVRIGIIPWSQYGNANATFTWGWAYRGSFYDPSANKITANNPNVVKALEWMISYSKKFDIRKVNAFAAGFGSREQDPFITGKLAMKCLHISEIDNIRVYAPNLDYGLCGLPAPRGGEENSSWVGGWCLGLPKGSKHPKAGWEFIKWCCHDPKGTSIVGKRQGLLPGYKASPYLKSLEGKPGYGVYLDILKQCRHQRPVMPAQTFYMTSLNKAVEYALYGKMTPKQALDHAARDTQAELDLRLAGR